MILYPIVRFTIEFFRDDPRGNLFGLTDLTGLSTSADYKFDSCVKCSDFYDLAIENCEKNYRKPGVTQSENLPDKSANLHLLFMRIGFLYL